MMRSTVSPVLSLALAIALAASRLGAQVIVSPVQGQGTIDGLVSDTSMAPLHAAFVSIVGTPIRVGTGPNGRFRITKLRPGQYLVIVKRVGYRPTSGIVDVAAFDTARLSYTLEPIVTTLATVTVSEKPFSIRMGEFLARRKLGMGEFMTQEEIEAKNTVYATELLRSFKTINVSPNRSSVLTEWYALSYREGANPSLGACPMTVYLDNVALPTPFNLDLLPSPKDLGAIEVYSGPATTPPQFAGFDRGCGVILVWTRDGSPSSP
ncbi:MAG TPA: carboxypeptidase-like regulatory domain-containing protein [Gemmatimonadaceae bacterium]|jgi:hypothetical protein